MIVKQQLDNQKIISILKNEMKKLEDMNSLLKIETRNVKIIESEE